MPETGQPVMLRTVSPQPPALVIPEASRSAKTSGSAASSSQCSWMHWRVVSSASPRPYRFETSPIVRSLAGVSTPFGIFTRSMKVPTFGLSWYSPHHWRRTMSSSGSAS